MKESILPLFLILLLTIEIDGSRSILRRKQVLDRCHRMQEVRRCSGAPSSWHFDVRVSKCKQSSEEECGSVGNRFRSKDDCEKICVDRCKQMQESSLCSGASNSWHFDVRVSECRISSDVECGALGNRFRSKEDCEQMCPGNLNISARQLPLGYHHPQFKQQHVHGSRYPDPCCHNNYPCNGHNCSHDRPIASPVNRHPCPVHHCPPYNCHHPCPTPSPRPEPIRHPCPTPQPVHPCPTPSPRPEPIINPCPSPQPSPEHPCHDNCNPCPYNHPRHPHPIQSPCPHNRCCGGCRTGSFNRQPCHHRCGYDCRHTTRPDCISTTVAPTSPITREQTETTETPGSIGPTRVSTARPEP